MQPSSAVRDHHMPPSFSALRGVTEEVLSTEADGSVLPDGVDVLEVGLRVRLEALDEGSTWGTKLSESCTESFGPPG